MKKTNWTIVLIVTILAVLLSGCGDQKPTAAEEVPVGQTEPGSAPSEEGAPIADGATNDTQTPSDGSSETLINHVYIPGEPILVGMQLIYDCNTGRRVDLGASVMVEPTCDTWEDSRLERPIHPLRGSYEPSLDIIEAQLGNDSEWIYAQIMLFGSAAASTAWYGFELDTDIDGSGELLLLVQNNGQLTDGWTVNGVQVWEDVNGDVGGPQPGEADGAIGDGYESLVFDSGSGLDADLVWARVAPDDPARVQFAFMPGLVGLPPSFAWWAWSGSSLPAPDRFDLVDQYDPQSLQGVDNSCAWGFNALMDDIPNRCMVIPMSTPTVEMCEPSDCGEDPCWVWDQGSCSCVYDYGCFN